MALRSGVPPPDGHLVFAGRLGVVFFGLVGIGVFPVGAPAQGTGSVLGRVSSQTEGIHLPNALVSIPNTGLEVFSGDEGWYFLTGVPPGLHEITVRLLGFAEGIDTVQISPDHPLVLDFELTPDPVPFDELVVNAEARPRGSSSHRRVIGREEIARRQASTFTQLLQGLVPGMRQTITSGDVGSAAQLRIRGVRSLEASPPLFFVDDVRIGSSHADGPAGTGRVLAFLDNINPHDVERIEVLHAAEATTLFGTDAVGGAILIYTKR